MATWLRHNPKNYYYYTVHGVAYVVAALWRQCGHTVVTLWVQSDSAATMQPHRVTVIRSDVPSL
jgi:hypothetical protein